MASAHPHATCIRPCFFFTLYQNCFYSSFHLFSETLFRYFLFRFPFTSLLPFSFAFLFSYLSFSFPFPFPPFFSFLLFSSRLVSVNLRSLKLRKTQFPPFHILNQTMKFFMCILFDECLHILHLNRQQRYFFLLC